MAIEKVFIANNTSLVQDEVGGTALDGMLLCTRLSLLAFEE